MRHLRAVLAVAALAAGLAGCTNGGSKVEDDAVPDKPRPGGVLRVGLTRVGSLDPAQARTVEQLLVADQLFDSLTTPHPATQEPQPSIAARWDTPDQKQWDFFLRPGLTFANGRAVTAADVKFTLERIAKPLTASPAGDLLQPVTGYAAFTAGSAPDLAGITTPAPNHVHISLDSPLSVLPAVLSSPVFGIVPKEAVDAAAPRFGDAPVGSGPFKFGSNKDDVIALLPVPGRAAFIQRMEIRQFDDVAASFRAFAAGALEWSRVPPDEVAAAGARYGDKGFKPYLAELFYGFNLKSPKFADPRFREAVVRAIDRRAITRAVYGSTVLPVDGLVVSGLPGHIPDACGAKCAHDPGRARSLIADAFKGAPPPELFVDYDEDETQAAVARAIQAGLTEVGVKATLRAKPLKDYQTFAVSGQQELFRLGWIGAYPSPDAFLQPLFATGSPSNLTGFSLPSVDAAFASARAEADPDKRLAHYQRAEKEILGLVPVVPIAQFQLHSVVAEGVHRLIPTAMGTFDASVVWLDRPAK